MKLIYAGTISMDNNNDDDDDLVVRAGRLTDWVCFGLLLGRFGWSVGRSVYEYELRLNQDTILLVCTILLLCLCVCVAVAIFYIK